MLPAMSSAEGSGKVDRVYRMVKADIEEGRFVSGQSLSEMMLGERTGASRTPVREAIRRLAAEGLVDLAPRRAPSVARISLRSVRALFDFRRMLEPAAVRQLAARTRDLPEISGVFGPLRAGFEALAADREAVDFADRFRFATADFDSELVRLTPNEYLARAIADLRPQSARLRAIAHEDQPRLGQSLAEHAEMCAAIVEGDGDRAAAGCATHLFHVEQAVLRSLLGEGPSRVTSDVMI